jgi:hypothetical protein
MTDLATKPKRSTYDEATKQRGLIAYVAASGNRKKAAEALAADGIQVDPSTIYYWVHKTHRDDYERIRAQMLPEIRERQADAHRDLEHRQLEVSHEAAELLKGRLPKMEDKDLINAMGKADIGSGIHAEKAELLNDRPTQRVTVDLPAVLKELKSLGVDPTTILDAEVVSEEDVKAVQARNTKGDHTKDPGAEA